MHNLKKTAAAVVVAGGVAVGGAAIGNAATSSPSAMPAHGSAAHEDAEKTVTGDAAAKAQAAAVKIVAGTAGKVTTDFPGTGYEVTVTKSDGSTVEVHLDSAFNEVQRPARGPAHGSADHENAEKAVTGDAAAKAQAAAVKIVAGTAGKVTTDFSGTGYEVTVTKSDGSTVEVHLDSSFNGVQMPAH